MAKQKAKCPHCGLSVSVRRWEGKVPVPFRHKVNPGASEWCPGTPKTIGELQVDLMGALRVERDVLKEYADEIIRHTGDAVRLMEKYGEASRTTTELVQQVTDAIRVELGTRA